MPTEDFSGFGNNQNALIIGHLNQIIQGINLLNETLSTLFPTADAAVTGSSGGASGDFLSVDINGTPYKIPLDLP